MGLDDDLPRTHRKSPRCHLYQLRELTNLAKQYFDSSLRDHVWFISASIDPKDPNHGFATFGMKVPLSLCNAGGNLHGGAVALIFDMCTSMALSAIARDGFWDTGHVSRTINCTYMRPAPEGTELVIENEVTHVGKTMAQLKGVMRRKDNGKICYTCEHGKVKVDSYKLHEPATSKI
jgi:acyl-coenzyme A thioesterase 13